MFVAKRNIRVIFFMSLTLLVLILVYVNVKRAREFRQEFADFSKNSALPVKTQQNVNKFREHSTEIKIYNFTKPPDLVDSRERKLFDLNANDGTRLTTSVMLFRAAITASTERTPTKVSEYLQKILNCHDRDLEMEKLPYGSYWLVRNFIRGTISRNVGCAETITYTANGDYTFFESLPLVIKSWLAPISFAVYTPGFDLNATMDAIQYVRNCPAESDLIQKYVSFHIYFPMQHMPKYLPLDEEEALNWPYDCNSDAEPPYLNVNRSAMYKTQNNLTYPINVGRNIARKSVNTHFIFACDIELIPSVGLAQTFLEMIARNQSILFSGNNKLRVFSMPVFEVKVDADIPKTKAVLKQMLKTKQAIPFHSKICKNCHLVPDQDKWLNASENNDELSVISVGKRLAKFRHWEPFYISDNREPFFDERVTWEGQSNKRIQGYAMCLLDYEYHILHPAFLVHSPGIKVFNKTSSRLQYVAPMNQLIKSTIQPEYRILYGNIKGCAN